MCLKAMKIGKRSIFPKNKLFCLATNIVEIFLLWGMESSNEVYCSLDLDLGWAYCRTMLHPADSMDKLGPHFTNLLCCLLQWRYTQAATNWPTSPFDLSICVVVSFCRWSTTPRTSGSEPSFPKSEVGTLIVDEEVEWTGRIEVKDTIFRVLPIINPTNDLRNLQWNYSGCDIEKIPKSIQRSFSFSLDREMLKMI